MKEEEAPQPLGGAARTDLLLVGSPARLADLRPRAAVRVVPCSSGSDALAAVAGACSSEAIEAVFADAQLVDMTGTGLLDRMAALAPEAARVLLVPEEDGGEHAAAPPSALVTDVWTAPTGAEALIARFERERRTLRRLHALQTQLEELQGAVEALRSRYLEARRARDLLVDSVGVRSEGGSRWWQDYRQLTALRETGCPLHRRTLRAEALEGELLRVGVDLVPGALGRDFAVQADPALLREILERLGAGLERHGQRGARTQAHCRSEGDRMLLELSAPLGRHCDAAALLDPLAALEGGPVEGAPLDLPLAEALAEVHGTALRISVLGGELRVRLALPRCAYPSRPHERRGSPVVRALDRTL